MHIFEFGGSREIQGGGRQEDTRRMHIFEFGGREIHGGGRQDRPDGRHRSSGDIGPGGVVSK